MAINIPIITEFSDKGLKSAEAGFAHFKGKVAEAEGGMGKLKAGFGAATDYMKANAGTFATVAGTAIAKFAADSIGAFQELAIAAGKFSDATGLAVDDASRWMEVAGDIGVEASDVQTMVGKMNKALGKTPELFADLEIPIARTEDGLTDVNETFLNAIENIQNIKDPTEKATVAASLFGKGWQASAELINMNVDDIRKNLADVSDAKVINEKELESARKLREETDKLKDKWEDLKLEVGQALVPKLTEALGLITDPSWSGFFENAKNVFGMTAAGQAFNKAKDFFGMIVGGSDESTDAITHLNDALGDNRNALQEARERAAELRQELGYTDEDLNGLIDTWDEMTGRFNDEATWNNLNQSFQDMMTAGAEAFGGNEKSAADFMEELANLTGDVGTYIGKLGDIPLDVQSDLQLLWDAGEFQAVMNYLDKYRQGVIIPVWAARREAITPSGQGSGRNRSTNSAPRPSSASTTSTSTAPPAEAPAGPPNLEIFGTPIGSNGGGGGRGRYPTVVVNVQGTVTSERDLVESIRQGLINSQRSGNQLLYSNT